MNKNRQETLALPQLKEPEPVSKELTILSPKTSAYDDVPGLVYIEMKTLARYWESQFKKLKSIKESLTKELNHRYEKLKEQHKVEKLAHNKIMDELKAKLALREKQLFSKKTEKKCKSEKNFPSTSNDDDLLKKKRGRQKGSPSHSRTDNTNLPTKNEIINLTGADAQCSTCNQPYANSPMSEESEIIEIEVKAYTRVIKRPYYKKVCSCSSGLKMPIAPSAPRVIKKGKLGVSVWVELLLSKFHYYVPHARKIRELSDIGFNLAPGTLTGGLKKINENYITPVYDALVERSKIAEHWHADETRWQVYEEVEGKASQRWYLWVFRSIDVIVHILDPSRSSRVPLAHLNECQGILSVDRYSAYKVFLKGALIILAYCWAHVRRDFIELANKYKVKDEWGMSWGELIGQLYAINNQRQVEFKAHEEAKKYLAKATVEKDTKAKAAAIKLTVESKDKYEFLHTKLTTAIKVFNDRSKEEQALLSKKTELTAAEEACRKVLVSLDKHWSGLTVFVEHPEIAMDNNLAENSIRGLVLLRKTSQGSQSRWAGECMAKSVSVFQTMGLHKINVKTWTTLFLQACADAGGKLPENWKIDFLPWNMSDERLALMHSPLPTENTS
jgi:transposase